MKRLSIPRTLVALLLGLALAVAGGCGGDGGSTEGPDGTDSDVVGDIGLDDTGGGDVGTPDVKPPPTDGSDEDVLPGDCNCTETTADVGPPPELAAMLAEGLEWLEKGQPLLALQIYEEALESYPDSVDAQFGAALAEMVDTTEFLLMILSLTNQVGPYVSTTEEPNQNEWFAEELHRYFDYLAEGYRSARTRLDALEDAELSFDVTAVPVFNVSAPFLLYRGTFDGGDVRMMRTVCDFAIFGLDVIVTQDLSTDAFSLISLVRSAMFDDSATVQIVLYSAAFLLSSGPTFLDVHPEYGPGHYAEARDAFIRLSTDLEDALEWMRAAGDPSDDEVSGLRVHPTNGTETYVLHAGVTTNPPEEPETFTVEFVLPPAAVGGFALMAESTEAPGRLVTWDDGPRWALSTLVTVALKLGVFGELSFGGITLSPESVNVTTLANLLSSLAPMPLAFDFGTMFQSPTGLRNFLPREAESGDTMIVEWECPAELEGDGWPNGPGQFLCDSLETLEDAAHFVDTDDEIAADGLTTTFPYFVWRDPTFHGLLHVKMAAIGMESETEYQLADQQTLNAALAKGLEQILRLAAL